MRHWLIVFVLMAMSCTTRASAFLAHYNRRMSYRASIILRDRQVHYKSTRVQVKHTDDDNREIWQPLTRTQIRRLKLAALREELTKRGLDTTGTRPLLMERLLETVNCVSTRGRKKEPNKTSPPDGNCPPLDPTKTYVLRVKGHGSMSYNSSGIGLVLYDAETVREVWVARKYFSQSFSSFEGDYRASILGIQVCLEQGAQKIVLQSDNDVMIKQVRGDFNVNKPSLKELCTCLRAVLSDIAEFDMTHISSAENTRAKNLAQRAVGTKKTVGLPEDKDIDALLPSQQDEVTNPSPELVSDEDDEDLFDDETHTVFSPEETYLLQFDGGARGNPGIAGSGMVLYDPRNMKELWCGWKYLGDNATNNAAEYNGLLLGMLCARSLGVRRLRAEGDSKLIVNQMNGSYKVREPSLKKLLEACKDAMQHLDYFEIRYIPRKANARADQLANQAMDTQGSFGFDELLD